MHDYVSVVLHALFLVSHHTKPKEYREELREIAGKGAKAKGGAGVADGNITLINQRHVGDDLPVNITHDNICMFCFVGKLQYCQREVVPLLVSLAVEFNSVVCFVFGNVLTLLVIVISRRWWYLAHSFYLKT